MKLPNEGCAQMPRPVRAGRAVPQPAFSAARFERGEQARRLAEHAAAEFDRILAGLLRELVDEALDREHVVVRSDAAPETGRHGRRLVALEFDAQIRNVVRNVDRAVDRIDVDALVSLNRPGRKRAMIDEPVTRCVQPTMRPSATLADSTSR